MQGRMHCYEGYTMAEAAYAVRVVRLLGAKTLFVTNAAGCVNTDWNVGELMLISDHIKLFDFGPSAAPNLEEFGTRFPDMSSVYTPRLRALAHEAAKAHNIPLREGVYMYFPGPQFETPAEVRARVLGADAVGMSTVPETIVAAHCGMEVMGVTLLANMAAGVLPQPLSGAEVSEAAEAAALCFRNFFCPVWNLSDRERGLSMATEKKQSFLGGAAVLAFGIVAVKIIGAVFKIPLRNILGEGGSADFSNAYNIYATLLTISTAGLPRRALKLVSESYALGRTRQAHRTFRVSLSVFLVLGVASFALMWWGSDLLAGFLNNPRAAYGIRALAPAVVCVGCLSAFRGYAQKPTVHDAHRRLADHRGPLQAHARSRALDVASAHRSAGLHRRRRLIAGVTAGTILSLVYMAIDYLRHRPRCAAASPARRTARSFAASSPSPSPSPSRPRWSPSSPSSTPSSSRADCRMPSATRSTRCAPPTATSPPAWTFTTCPPRSWSRSPPPVIPAVSAAITQRDAGSPPASCARPCASRRCSPSRWVSASGR